MPVIERTVCRCFPWRMQLPRRQLPCGFGRLAPLARSWASSTDRRTGSCLRQWRHLEFQASLGSEWELGRHRIRGIQLAHLLGIRIYGHRSQLQAGRKNIEGSESSYVVIASSKAASNPTHRNGGSVLGIRIYGHRQWRHRSSRSRRHPYRNHGNGHPHRGHR